MYATYRQREAIFSFNKSYSEAETSRKNRLNEKTNDINYIERKRREYKTGNVKTDLGSLFWKIKEVTAVCTRGRERKEL
jgi:hypothetical protein